MNCPNCGSQNSDSSKFCIHCGHALPVRTEAERSAPQSAQKHRPRLSRIAPIRRRKAKLPPFPSALPKPTYSKALPRERRPAKAPIRSGTPRSTPKMYALPRRRYAKASPANVRPSPTAKVPPMLRTKKHSPRGAPPEMPKHCRTHRAPRLTKTLPQLRIPCPPAICRIPHPFPPAHRMRPVRETVPQPLHLPRIPLMRRIPI